MKRTDEWKKHMSEGRKGINHTEEAKKKMSLAKIGKKPSEETRKKIGEAGRGRKHTEETKLKISEMKKGKKHTEETKRKLSGENCRWWKGGITPINLKIRMSYEYKLWREAVFKRDNWTCIWCGIKGCRKTPIQADHIKPFAYFPELRLAIDNGRTLCVPCHKKTGTWGKNMSIEEVCFLPNDAQA